MIHLFLRSIVSNRYTQLKELEFIYWYLRDMFRPAESTKIICTGTFGGIVFSRLTYRLSSYENNDKERMIYIEFN